MDHRIVLHRETNGVTLTTASLFVSGVGFAAVPVLVGGGAVSDTRRGAFLIAGLMLLQIRA